MQTWRIAFRNGTNGESLWLKCLEHGLAVIAYPGMDFDLSKHRPETRKAWRELSSSQKHSLRTFAYVIKPRDRVCVKEGPQIVGKGAVKSGYRFDKKSAIKASGGGTWPHTLGMIWDRDFRPVRTIIGHPQIPTIRPLIPRDLQKLAKARRATKKQAMHRGDTEAYEGRMLLRQARFRARNQALIIAKKSASTYLCEVCDFSFKARYGEIGSGYIIAHHAKPIGLRNRNLRTRLQDINLLCANCHVMMHKREPPFSVKELRKQLKAA